MAFDANKYDAAAPAAGGSMIGSALLGSQSWGVPAGFDAEGFLKASKANFVTLQDAWDRSDIQSLRAMMTDDMLEQIKTQLADRESHTGGQVNKTEVVMLDAQLLGIEELSDVYMASVEFSGMIREDASAGASPFREVWNMTKPRSGGSGWLVAGVQALAITPPPGSLRVACSPLKGASRARGRAAPSAAARPKPQFRSAWGAG
jgi:predicted lipid-binding transport protein (Tim44 family)